MTSITASCGLDLINAATAAAGTDKEALGVLRYLRRHLVDVPLEETTPDDIPMLCKKSFDSERKLHITKKGDANGQVGTIEEKDDDEDAQWIALEEMNQYLIAHSSTYEEYIQNRKEEIGNNGDVMHCYPDDWNSDMLGACAVEEKWSHDYRTDNSLVVYQIVRDESAPDNREGRIFYYSKASATQFMFGLELLRQGYTARAISSSSRVPSAPEVYVSARAMTSRLLDRAMNGLFRDTACSIHDHSIPSSDADPAVASRKRIQQAREMILEKMIDYFGEPGGALEAWVREEYTNWEITSSHLTPDSLMALVILNHGIDGTTD